MGDIREGDEMALPAFQAWLEAVATVYEGGPPEGLLERAGRTKGFADDLAMAWALLREVRDLSEAVKRFVAGLELKSGATADVKSKGRR